MHLFWVNGGLLETEGLFFSIQQDRGKMGKWIPKEKVNRLLQSLPQDVMTLSKIAYQAIAAIEGWSNVL